MGAIGDEQVDFSLIELLAFVSPTTLFAIFQMMLGLGLVIFVHELGHFLVAKACGVKCEKFYLGFDAFDIKIGDRVLIPRRLVHWRWGETEYGVGILPLGGYVKMLGQDDNPAQIAEERKRSLEEGAEEANVPKLDPRSYQAKTVPQRMAIISAGVIMNLIFAVIFAAIAFGTGVNYEPAFVGSTIPGAPAWQHNLDGGMVVEVSGQSTRDRYFTAVHLREAIVFDGKENNVELRIIPPPAYEDLSETPFNPYTVDPVSYSIKPATNLIRVKGAEGLPALGIGQSSVAILPRDKAIIPGQAAAMAEPPLEPGDKVVAVNGKSIVMEFEDENGETYRQHSLYLFRMLLARNGDNEIELTVERETKGSDQPELLTIKVPKNPRRTFGLTMQIGEIKAIQLGSPAEDVGLAPGDVITAIDGLPVGDPFTIEARMIRLAQENKTVELTIQRPKENSRDNEEIKKTITPRIPNTLSGFRDGGPMTIDSLGIAVLVRNKVVSSSELGGEAVSNIPEGSTITSVRLHLNDDNRELVPPLARSEYDIAENPLNWPIVDQWIQLLQEGDKVDLTYTDSDGKKKEVVATIGLYPNFYNMTRGFHVTTEQMNYQAKSVWESIQLGFLQTGNDATKVVKFLGKLIRGEIPLTGLGGPGTIAIAATSEASQGTSRLLLFLTLLSANLAVINFLPIPILDGGHMVFLTYEGVFRRPVSEKLQIILSFAGLIFIVGLMLLVISLDVWRWSGLF